MNHKIEELARQAADGMLSYDAEGEWQLSKREVQKFAELIVKECDKYVAERWDICEPWMNPGDLLKHFGVEE